MAVDDSQVKIKALIFPNADKIEVDAVNMFMGIPLPTISVIEIDGDFFNCLTNGLLIMRVNSSHVLCVIYDFSAQKTLI